MPVFKDAIWLAGVHSPPQALNYGHRKQHLCQHRNLLINRCGTDVVIKRMGSRLDTFRIRLLCCCSPAMATVLANTPELMWRLKFVICCPEPGQSCYSCTSSARTEQIANLCSLWVLHSYLGQEEKLDSRNDRSQKIFRSRTFSTATPGLDNGGGVIQGESKLYQIRVSAEKAKSLMA